MCFPSSPPQTPLACRHQRPELILCEAGPAPPPSGITCLGPPVALMHREQLDRQRNNESGICASPATVSKTSEGKLNCHGGGGL